jgi:hypothetical protein
VLYSRRLAARPEEDFARDLADCSEFDPERYGHANIAVRWGLNRALALAIAVTNPPLN